MRKDASCSGTPSQDNTRSHFWTTPPLGAATTLSGDGGMTLFTQTAGSVPAAAKVCVRFYDVPDSILNLISAPPTILGTTSYNLGSWPQQPAPVTFSFDFRAQRRDRPRRAPYRGADVGRLRLAGGHRRHLRPPSYATSIQLTAPE